jgi:hypothetical protein
MVDFQPVPFASPHDSFRVVTQNVQRVRNCSVNAPLGQPIASKTASQKAVN